MDKIYDAHDDLNDGNEGLKDSGRRGRRRPEDPWLWECFKNLPTFYWLHEKI